MVKYTHLPISCLVVMLVLFSGGDAVLAWAVMATLWASREWTQAEYRWIESLGNGTRASMPWWGGSTPRLDSSAIIAPDTRPADRMHPEAPIYSPQAQKST